MTGASGDGRATQVTAFTVVGVDQAAAPVLSQATSLGTAETSITAGITATVAKSLLVSAFGLGDQVTWAPGAGKIQAGYAGSGSAAGGASTEVVGSGSQDMSWSGPAAGRPTLPLAAYAAAPASGGGSPGDVAERYAYGPHGEGLDAGLGTIAFRYAGHRYDAETGLIYMRARYYSVAIGRFLSPDPIGYADGFNLYTYAANSPLNFIDPTGLAGQFAAQGFEGLTPIPPATLNAWRPRCLSGCNVFKAAGLQGKSVQRIKYGRRIKSGQDAERAERDRLLKNGRIVLNQKHKVRASYAGDYYILSREYDVVSTDQSGHYYLTEMKLRDQSFKAKLNPRKAVVQFYIWATIIKQLRFDRNAHQVTLTGRNIPGGEITLASGQYSVNWIVVSQKGQGYSVDITDINKLYDQIFRMVLMVAIFSFFRSKGFEEDEGESLVKWLTPDFYVRILPDDGNWTPEEHNGNVELCLYIYIYSPLFGRLMTEMFRKPDSLSWAYLPRKMRKDKEGCLAYAMVRVDLDEGCIEKSTVTSPEGPLSIKFFADSLDSLKTDQDIFDNMYDGLLKRMLARIEGMWVYLYLAKKIGYSPEKALSCAEQQTCVGKNKKAWHLKREMDVEIIKFFNGFYDRLSTSREN